MLQYNRHRSISALNAETRSEDDCAFAVTVSVETRIVVFCDIVVGAAVPRVAEETNTLQNPATKRAASTA